ncbi:MAG: glycosyltransferase family 4 protein [bacterium]|nr:glycosyltransferase family 4 protein [bacterium]MDZ4299852.1 glycosyltransferase family 4 protein [Candidatus Sungbacteria bacterium]
MPKPIIVVFSTSYVPFVGGAEIAIQETVRRLAPRFDFHIVTARFRRTLPRHEVRDGMVITRVGLSVSGDKWLLPFLGARQFFMIARSARRQGAVRPMVWGVDISHGALAGVLIKLLAPRTRFILTVQYGEGEERLRRGRKGFIGAAFRLMLARADAVTAISRSLTAAVRGAGYCGPLRLIPNGVDAVLFQNPGGQKADSEKKRNSEKIVITVSRLVHKNGIDSFIRAIAEVRKKTPEIRGIIIGDGPERRHLMAVARETGVADIVSFIGEVPYERIPVLLHDADVFVRPSRSEGMGNAFVEALAAGVPIVGTRVGGIPDIITEGVTGLFARVDEPADIARCVSTLLEYPDRAAMMVENGREHVAQNFSWDAIATAYGALFAQCFAVRRTVVVAAGIFPPDVGGPATYAEALIDALPAEKFVVRVAYFGAFRRLPPGVRHLRYLVAIAMQACGADSIFAQDPVSVGVPAALVALFLRKPLVMKIVGDYAWEQSVQRFGVTGLLDEFLEKKYGVRVEFLRRLERWSARRARIVIVPSEYLKTVVVRWGVEKNRIRVVHNAFPVFTPSSRDEARAKLDLSGFVLISAGRLVLWKGFELLIGLMPEIVREIPDARLIIVGSGPDAARLEEKITALHLGRVVMLAGAVPHEVLVRYLAGGDTFLLNTGYEGMSHVLAEAMRAGIPIVTTSAGGNPELIRDGETGIVAGYNDGAAWHAAILRVHNEREILRRTTVVRAVASVRRFSRERMIRETADILNSL